MVAHFKLFPAAEAVHAARPTPPASPSPASASPASPTQVQPWQNFVRAFGATGSGASLTASAGTPPAGFGASAGHAAAQGGSAPLFQDSAFLARPYRAFGKRALDLLLVLLALPFALPLLAVMALLVARDGHSPFYRQDRIGRGGHRFSLVKIRTMVPEAEAHLAAHLAQCAQSRAEWAETQKLKRDPRITRIGRVLRKSSLDELPQLWNVLTGDMSIVGPRPMMLDQQALYPGQAYYRMRPGITGPWQVSDRNNGSFAGRAAYDAAYDADLSLATDLSILLRTVTVVVRGTGY